GSGSSCPVIPRAMPVPSQLRLVLGAEEARSDGPCVGGGQFAPELDQLPRPNADKRLVRLDSGPSPHEPGAEVGEPRAIHLDGPACTHLPRHETRVRKEPDRSTSATRPPADRRTGAK